MFLMSNAKLGMVATDAVAVVEEMGESRASSPAIAMSSATIAMSSATVSSAASAQVLAESRFVDGVVGVGEELVSRWTELVGTPLLPLADGKVGTFAQHKELPFVFANRAQQVPFPNPFFLFIS
jgi:hypothetical protein